MAKVICCKEAGVDCDWTGEAPTEQELLQKVREHARKEHGMKEIPPELLAKAKSIIRDK